MSQETDNAPHAPPPAADSAPSQRPHIVILGAGFAGLTVARSLASVPADVTVVDRRNYHLFQPLLYQVATASLSPADIAWPIRRLLRRQRNTRVVLDEVIGVERDSKHVRMRGGTLSYDTLVIATGATHSYFGKDEWAEAAPGLKSLDDATSIRQRLLLAFERAEVERDAALRRRLLSVVIVGAGPTGVEMAGAVAELARLTLAADFRTIAPDDVRVVLVEAGPRVLAGFPDALSDYALKALDDLGVDTRLGDPVSQCDGQGVVVGDERIEAATIVWAAGVAASPAASWLGLEGDRVGRVRVDAHLNAGDRDIFVIGDTALVHGAGGQPLPGIAPVAKQQGAYVGRTIKRRIAGEPTDDPFRYRDRGKLATIGRKAAVIVFGRLRLRGRLAWWLWGIAHIYFLISLRNRILVTTQWIWAYLSFERGPRLITGTAPYQDKDGRQKE